MDCCTDQFDGRDGRAEISGWYGTAPETPLYVGLAADGWSEADEAPFTISSPEARLELGPIENGTHVEGTFNVTGVNVDVDANRSTSAPDQPFALVIHPEIVTTTESTSSGGCYCGGGSGGGDGLLELHGQPAFRMRTR